MSIQSGSRCADRASAATTPRVPACYEHRLAAAISHGAIWSVHDMWGSKDDDFGLAMHIRWVMGASSMKEAHEIMKPFTLEGHLQNMRCPYLIVHGGHDVLTVSAARKTYDYAQGEWRRCRRCASSNPTRPAPSIASTTTRRSDRKFSADWLADRFGIDQRKLLKTSCNPLI